MVLPRVVTARRHLLRSSALHNVLLGQTEGTASASISGVSHGSPLHNDHASYYVVPRYIEFVDELPQTLTGRVQKYRLRQRGVTADTWDRERAAAIQPIRRPRTIG